MLAIRFGIVVAYVAVVVMPVFAQLPNPYGTAINLESARKVATAAIAEARKNQWNMAIAIVDPAGELVYFEKLDGTQAASVTRSKNPKWATSPTSRHALPSNRAACFAPPAS